MNATTTMTERPVRHGGMFGPAILIGLGIVFLLNNLGLLGWEVWETLARLWPVLLIAAGLDLLVGRRSALASLLVVIVMLGIMVAAVFWSGAWVPASQALPGETISQPLGGAKSADIDIGMGAGTLQIGALPAESNQLIAGTIARGPREQVTSDFSTSGSTAIVRLRSRSQSIFLFPFSSDRDTNGVWDLKLNPDLPLRLTLNAGAGRSTIDLSRLRVDTIDINAGVGQTTLTLPSQGRVQAHVNGGVGQTTIVVPTGMAIRVTADIGLGRISVPGQGDLRRNQGYTSPNYDTADNRVEMDVHGGVGSIAIQQVSGR